MQHNKCSADKNRLCNFDCHGVPTFSIKRAGLQAQSAILSDKEMQPVIYGSPNGIFLWNQTPKRAKLCE